MNNPAESERIKPVSRKIPSKKSGPKLSDFKQQAVNANKHTQRGMSILESSMQDLGYTAPMIACADGEIIDGSARHETAANVFGSDAQPIVIESDGKRPIVVKRTDIKNADTPLAKKISLAANRIAQVNLDWNGDVLTDLLKTLDADDLQKLALTDADLKAMDLDSTPPTAPGEFSEVNENIETEHQCPKCGYKWSGNSAAKPDESE